MKYWHQLTLEEKVGVRRELEKHVAGEIPGFAVREKSSSWVMNLFGKVLFFAPGFMTNFVTTLYPEVYVPSLKRWNSNHANSISILSHEYVHLRDRKRLGWLFNLLYLSPQIFFLFFPLLACFGAPLWFILLGVVFLLPLPSLGRMWGEVRGYRMTMAVHFWLTGRKYNVERIASHFIGPDYYYMWPFKAHIRGVFEKEYQKILDNNLSNELAEVREVLTSAGVTCHNNTER